MNRLSYDAKHVTLRPVRMCDLSTDPFIEISGFIRNVYGLTNRGTRLGVRSGTSCYLCVVVFSG